MWKDRRMKDKDYLKNLYSGNLRYEFVALRTSQQCISDRLSKTEFLVRSLFSSL